MTWLACETARPRLEAFHDGELPLNEQLLVVEHLDLCPRCRAELEVFESVRAEVRSTLATEVCGDDLDDGLSTVLTRATFERDRTWRFRLARVFEDMHFVWSAAAALAAVTLCVAVGAALMRMAADERDDSLAGVLSALADPGSNRNPLPLRLQMRAPHVSPGSTFPDLFRSEGLETQDVVLALAAVVTKDGRVVNPAVLMSDAKDRAQFLDLLEAVHKTQFEPARFAGSPIAVNLVWLLAHTTVRGKLLS